MAQATSHRSAIIFLTGLSGSGKSTLASGLENDLKAKGVLTAVVDGDKLRNGLCRDLSYSEQDRHENIRRASEVAICMADIGAIVVVALIAPFRVDRANAAERAKASGIPFGEVFINAPLAVCEHRDPKNLYKRARAGEIKSFTGLDSPYEPPVKPDLEIHTDLESIAQSSAKLAAFALNLARSRGVAAAPS